MPMYTSDTELHSLDVALDRSLNNLAFCVGEGGSYIAEILVFPFHGRDHYVAYRLIPTGEKYIFRPTDERICNSHAELACWLVAVGIRKTKYQADKLLTTSTWKADMVNSILLDVKG